eukprot:scaffold25879_cov28-Tisochrysis_lutea.AAC.3
MTWTTVPMARSFESSADSHSRACIGAEGFSSPLAIELEIVATLSRALFSFGGLTWKRSGGSRTRIDLPGGMLGSGPFSSAGAS